MKKPAIPSVSGVTDPVASRALQAMKANVEIMTGAVGAEILQLASTASLADVINKINEMIRRQNRSGT